LDKGAMPLFMDVHHEAPQSTKTADIAAAHAAGLQTRAKHGVKRAPAVET
jgi:hypothetical protein